MKILYCGDIVGRAGREIVISQVGKIRQQLGLDVIVVNAENAAGGFGLSAKIAQQLFEAGVDIITLGNHAWDQKEMLDYIQQEPRILRPLNYLPGTPGKGSYLLTLKDGRKFYCLHVMGQIFMPHLDNPVPALEQALQAKPLSATVLVDIHAEATSEKQILANHIAGKVSAVVGSHTHVPTADHRLLPGGTAYITDAGMCGDYDSIIGMKKETAMPRYLTKLPGERLQPATVNGTLCGVLIETRDDTGKAISIDPIRRGAVLENVN